MAAPPYDVMDENEARAMVQGRPWSFLHVSRAEVDLPEGTDPYAPEVYDRAAANLAEMRRTGVLVQDPGDHFYAYRLVEGEHVQTGLVAVASVQAYDQGRIRRHELTRPLKEDDRVRQIEALNAQTGLVSLVYRAHEEIDGILAGITAAAPPDIEVRSDAGVLHQIWLISDRGVQERLTPVFDAMERVYIADGHHRSAAASRVAAARNRAKARAKGESAYDYFLAALFPHDQVRILDYNRVVKDLGGLDLESFLAGVAEYFTIDPEDAPVRPLACGEFGMYLAGQWYRLVSDRSRLSDDPVERLDVSQLSDHLLGPVLGIGDLRRDDRVGFVGGIRGLEALERLVDSGEMAVAFSLFPTGIEDLLSVADAGEIMPPKSTWFEPKLVDGLVSHLL